MRLTIHFPVPGFFAADMLVEVHVDGEVVHRGSFVAGFLFDLDLAPGAHTVETRIGVGLFTRKRRYVVDVPDEGEGLVATLDYSRTWGNFTEKLAVRSGVASPLPIAEIEPEPPSQPVRATFVVLAVLVVVFVLEYPLGVSPSVELSPSVATLSAMGGLGSTALRDGDVHRLLTCTLLHADPVHLVLNVVSLVLGGVLVERKLGSAWFFVVYTASAIGGSLMSLATNPGNIVSIGASGAILGLFSAGMVIAGAYPVEQRPALRLQLGRVLVPSLLFPLFQRHGQPVDVGAHLGGALVGAVMGYTLLGPLKKSATSAAPFHRAFLGKILASLAVLVTAAAAVVAAVRTYPASKALVAIEAAIIPNEERPEGPPTARHWDTWKSKYPGDPRVLLHEGDVALEARDAAGFERALREGRAAVKRTAPAFGSEAIAAFEKGFDGLEADRDLLLLVPEAEMPHATGEAAGNAWDTKLPALLAKYPNDPRVHAENALALYGKVAPERVLAEITLARALAPKVARFFPNGLDQRILAGVELLCLADAGKMDEVAQKSPPVCNGSAGETSQRMATARGLCGASPAP